MDQARLIARINRGYGKAAQRLGASCPVYRPGVASPVIHPSNQVATVMAAFDTSPDFGFAKPSGYGAPERWFGLFDSKNIRAGDVIDQPAYAVPDFDGGIYRFEAATYFVASLEAIHPHHCVRADRIVSIRRPAQPMAAGLGDYSGVLPQTEAVLASGVPAAIDMDRTGPESRADLPADAIGNPTWMILLPSTAAPKGSIVAHDIVEDELGQRYQVIGADWADQGYALTVQILST